MKNRFTSRRLSAFALTGLTLTLAAQAMCADAITGSEPQTPGAVQRVEDLLSTPMNASLSAVNSMLGNTNHVIASVADQWVQDDKAPTVVAEVAPKEEAEEPVAPVITAQAAAEAKTATVDDTDTAASVFAADAPKGVVEEADPVPVTAGNPAPVYTEHHVHANQSLQPTHYAQLIPAAGTDEQPAAPTPANGPAPAPAEPAPAAAAEAPAPATPAEPLPAAAEAPAPNPLPGFEATITEPSAPAADAAAPSPLLPQDATGEPEPTLAPQTKKTLAAIPSNIDTPPAGSAEHLHVEHVKKPPEHKDDKKDAKAPKKPAVNASVETGTPGFDLQYELQQGYGALSSGNTEAAISIYTSVLDNDPDNKQALFGIASAYHRVGQIEKARPYYSRLLKIDPANRAALNNFMALAAEEAPQEALRELQELQGRNPDFSPIPAQIAYVYEKLGQGDEAIENMQRAVGMEPENLTYRYNLAVMYDKAGRSPEAVELYKQIVSASNRGERVPGSLERVQERLTYLSANAPK